MGGRYAVIMAGGRGERFWPLSTSKHPKQLLALVLLIQRAQHLATGPSTGASAMVIRSHAHSPVIDLPGLGTMVLRVRSAASAGERTSEATTTSCSRLR